MPDVIVVGAGPVGLLMAAELHRRGVDVDLVDQRVQATPGSRAIGLHAPVLAALEDSGLTADVLTHALRVTQGQARSRGNVLGTVRFDRLSTRFPFVATLPQEITEQVLARRAPEPARGVNVTEINPTDWYVRLYSSADVRQAPLVVLAGGTRSRHLVYSEPRTRRYPDRYLMTDAQVADSDDAVAVVHLDGNGVLESFPLPGQRRRFVAWDPPGGSEDSRQRRRRLDDALADRGESTIHDEARTVTEFGVRRFVAPWMRRGRLFVIGDAAHEVSPIGGQGMNLGLLDAAGLAPLLTAWVRTGTEPSAALGQWERARVRSAIRAARLAGINTRLGRPAPRSLDVLRRAGIRLALGPGSGRLFAHAYAMGLDAGT